MSSSAPPQQTHARFSKEFPNSPRHISLFPRKLLARGPHIALIKVHGSTASFTTRTLKCSWFDPMFIERSFAMRTLIAMLLSLGIAINCFAQVDRGNTFRVRYNGGTTTSTVRDDDWNNIITVAPDSILLVLKDGQEIKIDPNRVTALTYGRTSSRN